MSKAPSGFEKRQLFKQRLNDPFAQKPSRSSPKLDVQCRIDARVGRFPTSWLPQRQTSAMSGANPDHTLLKSFTCCSNTRFLSQPDMTFFQLAIAPEKELSVSTRSPQTHTNRGRSRPCM